MRSFCTACRPYRGEEISAEVMEGTASRIFDQAENRLHAQQALLAVVDGWSVTVIHRWLVPLIVTAHAVQRQRIRPSTKQQQSTIARWTVPRKSVK